MEKLKKEKGDLPVVEEPIVEKPIIEKPKKILVGNGTSTAFGKLEAVKREDVAGIRRDKVMEVECVNPLNNITIIDPAYSVEKHGQRYVFTRWGDLVRLPHDAVQCSQQ